MSALTSDSQMSSKRNSIERHINQILKTISLKIIIPRMSQYFKARDFIDMVSEFHDPCSFKDRHSESFLGTCINEKQYELLEYLLTLSRIDPNIQNKDGSSPLMLACIQKKKVVVEMLLNHEKTDPNIKTLINESPLERAITVGYIPNVQLLISDPRVNINIPFSKHQLFKYSHLLTHVIDMMSMTSEASLYSSQCKIVQLMLEHPQIELSQTSYDIYILLKREKNIPLLKKNSTLRGRLIDLLNESKKKINKVKSKSDKKENPRKGQISSLIVVSITDDNENDDDIINWDEPD